MRIDSKTLAIDPSGCGCTDCIVGIYVPLNYATDDHIQALMLGLLRDNTGTTFNITANDDGTYAVTSDPHAFTITKIGFPIPVDNYTLDVPIDTIIDSLVHLTRYPDPKTTS